MKVTVVGAGAVGGYFGGRLQEAGLDVTFLVRAGRAQQLERTGLVIQSPYGDVRLVAKVATRAEDIDGCDVILLSVKNYHLPGALESIRPLCQRGAKILPLLNGVEHYEVLRAAFGEDAVLGGLCQIIATLDEDGRIIHTSSFHQAVFGSLQAGQEALCKQLADKVRGVNAQWKFSQSIMADIWTKYIFITAFSAITTASRLPIDEVLASASTGEVFRVALAELSALATAAGISLQPGLANTLFQRAGANASGTTSSMHQDFRKGLPLEVESLQGAAVRLAEKLGVDVPVIRTLYGLIKPFEAVRP